MQLFPYQEQAVEAVLAGFREFQRQLVVIPTGGGKTIIFSHLAHRLLPKKTLILAHRDELIDQAIEKLCAATGLRAGREKAESSATLRDEVVVASVQTMGRRLGSWAPDHFGLIVADEAHHAISPSWQHVLTHFDENAWVLGVTATPDRGDARNLGTYFENIATEIGLFDLVHQGYLCPIVLKSVPVEIDLTKVRTVAGDFSDADLGHALEPYLEKLAPMIAEECGFRRTLCFLPLIAISKQFTALLCKAGLQAEHVDGMSPDRAERLARFSNGQTDVLCNAMLLTEGYDCPAIDCVICLRPTKSRPLYAQMIGRGTRVSPGKTNLLLLDFLWLHEKHSLIHPADLVARSSDISRLMTEKAAAGGQGELDLENLMSEAEASRASTLAAELAATAKRRARVIDAMEFAISMNSASLLDYEPAMKWEEDPVTDAQAALLSRSGIDLETVTCKGHASKLIDVIIGRSRSGLCTPKQAQLLRRLRHPYPERATFEQARAFLDRRLGGRK